MREQRLLERIAALQVGGDADARSRHARVEVLIESIRNHLQRILNTRRGSVPIDPDFGVPDFTNLAGSFSSGTTREVMDSLTDMISRYEPRLKHPRILVAEGGREILSLNFSLEGDIEVNDRDIPIRLTTQVSSSGKVSLQRSWV